MTYATLMVNLDLGLSNAGVLGIAKVLATRFNADVIGAVACKPLKMIYGESLLSGATLEQDREKIEKRINDAESEFRSALQTSGAPLHWCSTTAFESPTDWLAHKARCADLLITGVASGFSFDASRSVNTGDLVMQVARPVLLVPEAAESLSLERVVVAWSDTRESMRAIADALPLLKQSVHVAVVEIAATRELGQARGHLEDVVAWLKAHGVIADSFALAPTGFDANQLNTFAREHAADLIVAGAYGHSRFREWAFGGVTRDLLLQPERCTLVSH